MIGPGDKELLVTADTPEEVCDHVRQRQRALASRPIGVLGMRRRPSLLRAYSAPRQVRRHR